MPRLTLCLLLALPLALTLLLVPVRGLEAPPGSPTEGGTSSPDGSVEIGPNLPDALKVRNVGGSDGAGLCVFTSIQWASHWQNERALWGLQQWMRSRPGGSWPEKTDRVLSEFAPGVRYLQDTTGDLAILEEALASGRLPCVTYAGRDPHYRSRIAHMVNLVYLDAQHACIADNNYPGEQQHVWMSRAAFQERYRDMGGGWCVILLRQGPPPPPRN